MLKFDGCFIKEFQTFISYFRFIVSLGCIIFALFGICLPRRAIKLVEIFVRRKLYWLSTKCDYQCVFKLKTVKKLISTKHLYNCNFYIETADIEIHFAFFGGDRCYNIFWSIDDRVLNIGSLNISLTSVSATFTLAKVVFLRAKDGFNT